MNELGLFKCLVYLSDPYNYQHSPQYASYDTGHCMLLVQTNIVDHSHS